MISTGVVFTANKGKRLKRLTTLATTSLLLTSLTLHSLPSFGCGPFFKTAIFDYYLHPGLPLKKYSQGSLSVLRPSFARSYLVVAYRYLSDKPLNKQEQEAAMKVWRERLLFEHDSNIENFAEKWIKARAKVKTDKVSIDPYGRGDNYLYYLRFNRDSFKTAIDSLESMITKYGIKSKEVAQWVDAQDKVFAVAKKAPQPLAESTPEYTRKERDYQIASHKFYSNNFDEAIVAFKQIADDKNSRWNKIAPYLIARCLIRKANLVKNADKASLLEKAKETLDNIIADKSKSSLHSMSKNLLQYVEYRRVPSQTLNEIAKKLSKGNSPQTFKNDLGDITNLLDGVSVNTSSEKEKGLTPSDIRADLTDWVWTFNRNRPESLTHSLKKWRDTNSLPWLVCCLSLGSSNFGKLNAKDLTDLLNAAQNVSSQNPGYLSVAYYQTKLLIKKGALDQAAKVTAAVLGNKDNYNPTTINLFKTLQLNLVKSLDEFVQLIPRKIAGDDYSTNVFDIPLWFFSGENKKDKRPEKISIDPITATLLNKGLSVDYLVKVAENNKLPLAVKKNLIPAVWLRAVLLNKERQAINLSKKVEIVIPELKSDMVRYRSAMNSNERKFLALYTVSKNPGLKPYVTTGYKREEKLNEIDSFRNNWWDEGKLEVCYDGDNAVKIESIRKIASRILTPGEITIAKTENDTLANLGTAPNYLANQIVTYAKTNPKDTRVPEALHRAVKATRYGYTNKNTTPLSKACFQLLHKRYPKSSWTKKTPYYF